MLPKFSQIVNRLYAFIYKINHSKSGLGLPSIVALGRHEKAFFTVLKKFIEHFKPLVNSSENVKCPCKSCRNVSRVSIPDLPRHIMNNGCDPSYKTWTNNGEPNVLPPVIHNTSQPQMMIDMTACLNDLSYISLNNKENKPTQGDIGETSVETIDVATGQKFNMRAMVLWTINDFPARSSLCGWSGQGYKACPTCNEDTTSTCVLGKTYYVIHRFLKNPLKWRRSLDFNDEIKDGDPPRKFDRDDIMAELARLPTRVKGNHLMYEV
nr:hypothetical protein [Tanacetum cinerariifolium]